MKLTMLFALLATGFFQIGITPLAEMSYLVAGILAYVQGGRSVAHVTSQIRLSNLSSNAATATPAVA